MKLDNIDRRPPGINNVKKSPSESLLIQKMDKLLPMNIVTKMEKLQLQNNTLSNNGNNCNDFNRNSYSPSIKKGESAARCSQNIKNDEFESKTINKDLKKCVIVNLNRLEKKEMNDLENIKKNVIINQLDGECKLISAGEINESGEDFKDNKRSNVKATNHSSSLSAIDDDQKLKDLSNHLSAVSITSEGCKKALRVSDFKNNFIRTLYRKVLLFQSQHRKLSMSSFSSSSSSSPSSDEDSDESDDDDYVIENLGNLKSRSPGSGNFDIANPEDLELIDYYLREFFPSLSPEEWRKLDSAAENVMKELDDINPSFNPPVVPNDDLPMIPELLNDDIQNESNLYSISDRSLSPDSAIFSPAPSSSYASPQQSPRYHFPSDSRYSSNGIVQLASATNICDGLFSALSPVSSIAVSPTRSASFSDDHSVSSPISISSDNISSTSDFINKNGKPSLENLTDLKNQVTGFEPNSNPLNICSGTNNGNLKIIKSSRNKLLNSGGKIVDTSVTTDNSFSYGLLQSGTKNPENLLHQNVSVLVNSTSPVSSNVQYIQPSTVKQSRLVATDSNYCNVPEQPVVSSSKTSLKRRVSTIDDTPSTSSKKNSSGSKKLAKMSDEDGILGVKGFLKTKEAMYRVHYSLTLVQVRRLQVNDAETGSSLADRVLIDFLYELSSVFGDNDIKKNGEGNSLKEVKELKRLWKFKLVAILHSVLILLNKPEISLQPHFFDKHGYLTPLQVAAVLNYKEPLVARIIADFIIYCNGYPDQKLNTHDASRPSCLLQQLYQCGNSHQGVIDELSKMKYKDGSPVFTLRMEIPYEIDTHDLNEIPLITEETPFILTDDATIFNAPIDVIDLIDDENN